MTYVYEVGKEFLLRNGFTAIVIDTDFESDGTKKKLNF